MQHLPDPSRLPAVAEARIGSRAEPRSDRPRARIVLVGDAGAEVGGDFAGRWNEIVGCARPRSSRPRPPYPKAHVTPGQKAVFLDAVGAELREHGATSAILWLGDNIYESGIDQEQLARWDEVVSPDGCYDPGEHHATAAVYESMMAQVAASLTARHALFVPGNHDWNSRARRDPAGLERVRAQQALIGRLADAAHASDRIGMRPENGRVGPDALDVELGGVPVRLVFLDTEAILSHLKDSAGDPRARCAACGKGHSAWASGLIEEIAATVRVRENVLVAAHHPLATRGPHGGRFPVGTAAFKVLASKLVRHDQSLAGSANKRMRELLRCAFRRQPPLAYVSGHEHTLQVLRERDERSPWLLVSGAGSKRSPVGTDGGWGIQSSGLGYMVLEVYGDGEAQLEVVEPPGRRLRVLLQKGRTNAASR
jgi:hypothetical protein